MDHLLESPLSSPLRWVECVWALFLLPLHCLSLLIRHCSPLFRAVSISISIESLLVLRLSPRLMPNFPPPPSAPNDGGQWRPSSRSPFFLHLTVHALSVSTLSLSSSIINCPPAILVSTLVSLTCLAVCFTLVYVVHIDHSRNLRWMILVN